MWLPEYNATSIVRRTLEDGTRPEEIPLILATKAQTGRAVTGLRKHPVPVGALVRFPAMVDDAYLLILGWLSEEWAFATMITCPPRITGMDRARPRLAQHSRRIVRLKWGGEWKRIA